MAQTDNLQDSSPDVQEAVTGNQETQDFNDPGEFFAGLEQSVNGLVADKGVESQQITSKDLKAQPKVEQSKSPVADTNTDQELETLKKRYSDSSREAKRLNTRLNELEKFAPLLDRMREDPQLISTVRNYIEGGGKQGVKERLGVSEDFVFDPDEAISDPSSDSAKVFDSVVNQKVSQIVSGKLNAEKQKQELSRQTQEFRKKHDMTDEQYKKFMEFATSRPLNFDDIYYLMNRENHEKNVASETRKEVAQQMANVRQKPQSLAGSGAMSQDKEQSVDDAIFDSMLKEGLDNLFT